MDALVKVFICYVREDKEIAQKLCDDLKHSGLKPWIDIPRSHAPAWERECWMLRVHCRRAALRPFPCRRCPELVEGSVGTRT